MGNAISLDVGPSAIMVTTGRYSPKEVVLDQMFRIELPPGCVVDGAVTDKATFKTALSMGLGGYRTKTRRVMLTMHTNSAIQRRIEVPAASRDELEALVDFELKQYLPAGKEYVIDYVVLRRMLNEQGARVVVVKAMGIPRETCDAYYDILNEIGLKPVAMDVHMQGVSKLFASGAGINGHAIPEEAICVLDISTFQTIIHLLIDGEIDLSRTLPLGLANLERMFADRMGISLEEASIRLKSDIRQSDMDAEAMESIRRFFNQLIAELRKIAQYARMKTPPVNISAFYLYGSGADLPWIEKFFQESLEAPVTTVSHHDRIHQSVQLGRLSITPYLNAAGMMLRA